MTWDYANPSTVCYVTTMHMLLSSLVGLLIGLSGHSSNSDRYALNFVETCFSGKISMDAKHDIHVHIMQYNIHYHLIQ